MPNEKKGVLNEIFIYKFTIIEIFSGFKMKLIITYCRDEKWSKIYMVLQKNKKTLKKGKICQFSLENKFIYYKNLANL